MDYIHNGKKGMNCGQHPARTRARTLLLGPRMRVHLNHVKTVMDAFNPLETGLRQGDHCRKGYRAIIMDWPSLLRCISVKCLGCMQELVDGSRSPEIPANPAVQLSSGTKSSGGMSVCSRAVTTTSPRECNLRAMW